MGRKNLLASTTKKKATTKKKTASKKSVKAATVEKTTGKSGAKETSVSKKPAVKVTAAGKAAARVTKPPATKAKAKNPAKKKVPAKKKAPVAKKKQVTLKDLLFKQFVFGKTASKPVKVEKKAVKIPEAPAFVSGYGKDETDRIRKLLFKRFDLKAAKKEPPVTKSAALKAPSAKKKAVTLKDLIFKEFEIGAVIVPIKIEKPSAKIPESPPFISGYDQKEMERIRALLFKAFDLRAKAPVKKAQDATVRSVPPTPVSPEVPVYEPSAPSAESAETGSMNKGVRMGLYALALLIAIIVGTSFSNRSKFYLKEVDNGVEVWRGKFAPAGTELVYKLDGVTVPNPLRESYTQKEISPILFGFFLDKADAVLNVPAGPDIPKMKDYLRQAATFAPSVELQTRIQRRLKGVDFIIAFHKADVALSKGTMPDLRVAKVALSRAHSSATTDFQRELVEKTQLLVDEAMASLNTK